MKLYDTHCHFERADEDEIRAQLRRAKIAGVEKVMAVGGSPALNASAETAVAVAAKAPDGELPAVVCALGYDRDQAEPMRGKKPAVAEAAGLAAWGEIGLDYHYSPETRDGQLALFAAQLEAAAARKLPVVIHTRDADEDTLGLLREIPSKGIIHCFTGSPQFGRKLLDLGFHVSISGIVTFKSAENVRETARMIPDDRLLIETDSPYLAPVPMRGQANEPGFVRYTCEFLAKLRGVSAGELAEITFGNAERIIGPAKSMV